MIVTPAASEEHERNPISKKTSAPGNQFSLPINVNNFRINGLQQFRSRPMIGGKDEGLVAETQAQTSDRKRPAKTQSVD